MFRNVRIVGGGKIQFGGLDAMHRVGAQLDGVLLTDDPREYKITAAHADVVMGPGPVNFGVSGDDVKVTGTPGKGTVPSCAAKFVPFPEH